eukprot:gnl/MRDRNA2_/MRDRNA2_248983_c0_seq1.p1 gnl/MRDRNA2_/MRDRNA2_248983_c0~~gnl/MRDRNA2_/MRDRNA2_248983_c0_seq1.p1  ORF type:complete len:322 (-),score=59.99 gnl/MRDRNA2_/MRDRNA2_248983_c0_seq1:118-999(-)
MLVQAHEDAEVWGVDLEDKQLTAQQNLMGKCRRCNTTFCKSLGVFPFSQKRYHLGGGDPFEVLSTWLAGGSVFDVVYVGCSLDMRTTQFEALLEGIGLNVAAVFTYGSQSKQAMFHVSFSATGRSMSLSSCRLLMPLKFTMPLCVSRNTSADNVVRPGPFDRHAFCSYVGRAWMQSWGKRWRKWKQREGKNGTWQQFKAEVISRSEVAHQDLEGQDDVEAEEDADGQEESIVQKITWSRAVVASVALVAVGALMWVGQSRWSRAPCWTRQEEGAAELGPYLGFETDAENEQDH